MANDDYSPQDLVPLPPPDAKVHTTACDYCIVACGYKAYTWPLTSENGGPNPEENALGALSIPKEFFIKNYGLTFLLAAKSKKSA